MSLYHRQDLKGPPVDARQIVHLALDNRQSIAGKLETLAEGFAALIARLPNEDDRLAVLNTMSSTNGPWVGHKER